MGMRKAAFQQFPPPPQQFFAVLAANPPPVAVHPGLCLRFVFPISLPSVGLRDIGPHFRVRQRGQCVSLL